MKSAHRLKGKCCAACRRVSNAVHPSYCNEFVKHQQLRQLPPVPDCSQQGSAGQPAPWTTPAGPPPASSGGRGRGLAGHCPRPRPSRGTTPLQEMTITRQPPSGARPNTESPARQQQPHIQFFMDWFRKSDWHSNCSHWQCSCVAGWKLVGYGHHGRCRK